jgi:Ca2+-binding RTX toxin-like protein
MNMSRRLLLAAVASAAMFIVLPSTASASDPCFGSAATITGTPGDDPALNGTAGIDVINGGGGNDIINGLGGNDKICGDSGDDMIDGGPGSDQLDGEGHVNGDTVTFVSVTSQLAANLATDTASQTNGDADSILNFENLTGTNTFDSLVGDAGPNVLTGLDAADSFEGGAGDDQLVDQGFPVDFGAAVYPDATGPVTGTIGAGSHTVSGSGVGTDTLTNVRGIQGSPFDDHLTGDGIANSLNGKGGNDVLEPLGGSDFVTGFDGIDTVTYENETGPITTADLSNGNNNVTTQAGTDSVDTTENLIGSPQGDTITGGTEDNVFDGRGGDDQLAGGGGTDTATYAALAGPLGVNVNLALGTAVGQGSDTLTDIDNVTGSLQSDVLFGDAGVNVLAGLADNDNVDGQAGPDQLLLGPGTDIVGAADGEVDSIDCTGGGPDSGSVDGPAPAETYAACDTDGDDVVDFLDACPTTSGSGSDGCVPPPVTTPPVTTPPTAVPPAPVTTQPKKKCKKKKHRAATSKKCKKKKRK